MGTVKVNQSFSYFGQFSEAAEKWQVDFIQTIKGKFNASLFLYESPRMIITRAFLRLSHKQNGEPPKGTWTFGIPAVKEFSLNSMGKTLDHNQMLIYPPGSEISCVAFIPFDIFALSVTHENFEKLCDKKESNFINRFKKSDVLLCDEKKIEHLRQLLVHLHTEATLNRRFPFPLNALGSIELRILDALFQTIDVTIMSKSNVAFRLRDGAFNQAIACIESYPKENLTVKALTSVTGVSERTLEYAFKEKLGLSPKEYIKSYRLHVINRLLSAQNGHKKRITNIAFEWGFTHMGQFSQDYKKMFGELPSETLKKNTISL